MENTLQNKAISANLGYTDTLAILPFDHRTGLYRELGWTEPLSPDQVVQMKDGRRLIYDAIRQAVTDGIPMNETIVFTDDLFGAEILHDAQIAGFMTSLTTEQSGTPYFAFEHGDTFTTAIEAIKPIMVKALVRYNPDGDGANNDISRANLKKLSDYAHAHGYKFLIEPLVPATDDQLASVGNDKYRYDRELRPNLTVAMMNELQDAGVEPDVWKIEGFDDSDAYRQIVDAARNTDERSHVGVIALGRNETDTVVESWLRAGALVPGVIGFAVGRTVFLDPLLKYMKHELPRGQAINEIAEKFRHFYDVFIAAKKA